MIGVDHFFLYVDYATEQTRAALKPYTTGSSDPIGTAPVATVVNWLDVVDRSLDSLSMTESNEASAAAHKALGHDHVWFSQTMPFMRLQVKSANFGREAVSMPLCNNYTSRRVFKWSNGSPLSLDIKL